MGEVKEELKKQEKKWEEIKGEKKPFVYQDSPIMKAVKQKQAGIKASMDAKAEQFSIQGSCADATAIMQTFYPELATSEDKEKVIKEKWNYWREWFYHKRADFKAPEEPFV